MKYFNRNVYLDTKIKYIILKIHFSKKISKSIVDVSKYLFCVQRNYKNIILAYS